MSDAFSVLATVEWNAHDSWSYIYHPPTNYRGPVIECWATVGATDPKPIMRWAARDSENYMHFLLQILQKFHMSVAQRLPQVSRAIILVQNQFTRCANDRTDD